jgi:hypothetical protein
MGGEGERGSRMVVEEVVLMAVLFLLLLHWGGH